MYMYMYVNEELYLFRCSMCDVCLSNWYFEKNGRLYCKNDYVATFGEACNGCSQTITGPLMVSRLKKYFFIAPHSVGSGTNFFKFIIFHGEHAVTLSCVFHADVPALLIKMLCCNQVIHEMGTFNHSGFDLVKAACSTAPILVQNFTSPPLHGIHSNFTQTYMCLNPSPIQARMNTAVPESAGFHRIKIRDDLCFV